MYRSYNYYKNNYPEHLILITDRFLYAARDEYANVINYLLGYKIYNQNYYLIHYTAAGGPDLNIITNKLESVNISYLVIKQGQIIKRKDYKESNLKLFLDNSKPININEVINKVNNKKENKPEKIEVKEDNTTYKSYDYIKKMYSNHLIIIKDEYSYIVRDEYALLINKLLNYQIYKFDYYGSMIDCISMPNSNELISILEKYSISYLIVENSNIIKKIDYNNKLNILLNKTKSEKQYVTYSALKKDYKDHLILIKKDEYYNGREEYSLLLHYLFGFKLTLKKINNNSFYNCKGTNIKVITNALEYEKISYIIYDNNNNNITKVKTYKENRLYEVLDKAKKHRYKEYNNHKTLNSEDTYYKTKISHHIIDAPITDDEIINNTELNEDISNNNIEHCKNCFLVKSGECNGNSDGNICEDYRALFKVNDYDKSNWPKGMEGAYSSKTKT